MALAATHLCIALDLIPLTKVSDYRSYYAGTLYPDSRNATGIERDLTHNDKYLSYLMNPEFSDFHTGWAIHLLYDKISGEMQKALMPPGLVLSHERNYAWAYFTAIKIIEDMNSAQAIDAQIRILASVPINQAPNNESLVDLRKYFTAVEALYRNGAPTLDAYEALFHEYRLPTQVLSDMIEIATKLLNNETSRRRINAIYKNTFEQITSTIKRRLPR